MKARDVMSPIEAYLSTDMPICEAVIRMRNVKRQHGLPIKGMLVKNGKGEIVGILSIKDIIRAVIPSYLSPDISLFSWEHMLEQMTDRAKNKVVGEIMTKDIVTINSEAALMVCADLMVKKGLQRLPVTEENGQIIGMVYMRDIYDFIADLLTREEKADGTC
ncbi:MAG TPA: CBS domain-containing protein [Desulfobulbus sp.]|nr:CBS domain-containing protein [Desulfobulbus sp.]